MVATNGQENNLITFVSHSINLAVLPSPIPPEELSKINGDLALVTFNLTFLYKDTYNPVDNAFALLLDGSSRLATISNLQPVSQYLTKNKQYTLQIYPAERN